eukprot:4268548-Alexandrium_andersonii.AAC.1
MRVIAGSHSLAALPTTAAPPAPCSTESSTLRKGKHDSPHVEGGCAEGPILRRLSVCRLLNRFRRRNTGPRV